MLNHNELAIIKDGILTLDGYSCSMVYRMLGICGKPGKYPVDDSSNIEDACWCSDGNSVWMEEKDTGITSIRGDKPSYLTKITKKKTKEELLLLRDSINYAISNYTRYYEVKGSIYRVTPDDLFYLKEVDSSGDVRRYIESRIALSVIDNILKGSVPMSNKIDTLIYTDRRLLASQDKINRHYLAGNMYYFGYTKVDDYYVRIDWDETLCIEVCDEDNVFNVLHISFEDIKELIVIDYLKDEER